MKKKILIPIIILILILISILSLYFYKRHEDKVLKATMIKKEVEVYTDINISTLLKKKNIIDDYKINTKKLGKKIYTYYYKDLNNKKKKAYLEISVIDKTPPLVWLNNSYNVLVNSEDTLIDSILCGDNYDKNPKCIIEGNYDLKSKGSYNLKYIATDSSNNKTEIIFTLNVVEKREYSDTSTKYNEVYKIHKKENTKIGLDISSWQGEIDFKKLKENNVSFVMIRLGYQKEINNDELILDEYFKKNIEEATKHNIDVGVYFYSKASTIKEAIKQADFVYKNIKEYDITLPVAFDWEIYTSFNSLNISLNDLNDIANSFNKRIEKYGYTPALYGSKNYLEKIWTNNKYQTWLAHYTDNTTYENDYFMWQMCMNGKIDGIDGYVDIDILYEDEL